MDFELRQTHNYMCNFLSLFAVYFYFIIILSWYYFRIYFYFFLFFCSRCSQCFFLNFIYIFWKCFLFFLHPFLVFSVRCFVLRMAASVFCLLLQRIARARYVWFSKKLNKVKLWKKTKTQKSKHCNEQIAQIFFFQFCLFWVVNSFFRI